MKQIIIISVVGLVLVGVILLVMSEQNKANIEMLKTVTQINTDSQTDVKECSKDWLCATTSLLGGLGGMFSIVK